MIGRLLFLIIKVSSKIILSLISKILVIIIGSDMPVITNYFDNIILFFVRATQFIGWWISALGIPYDMVALLVSVLVFRLVTNVAASVYKTILAWYRKLVP